MVGWFVGVISSFAKCFSSKLSRKIAITGFIVISTSFSVQINGGCHQKLMGMMVNLSLLFFMLTCRSVVVVAFYKGSLPPTRMISRMKEKGRRREVSKRFDDY